MVTSQALKAAKFSRLPLIPALLCLPQQGQLDELIAQASHFARELQDMRLSPEELAKQRATRQALAEIDDAIAETTARLSDLNRQYE